MTKSEDLKYMSKAITARLLTDFLTALDKKGGAISEIMAEFDDQKIPEATKRAEAIIQTAGNIETSEDLIELINQLKSEMDDDYPDYQTILDLVSQISQALNWASGGYFNIWNYLMQEAFVDTYKVMETQIPMDELIDKLKKLKELKE